MNFNSILAIYDTKQVDMLKITNSLERHRAAAA